MIFHMRSSSTVKKHLEYRESSNILRMNVYSCRLDLCFGFMFTFVYRSNVTREIKLMRHTSGGWHWEQSLIVAARDEPRHRCEECMTLLRCWRLWQKVCMSQHVCKSEQHGTIILCQQKGHVIAKRLISQHAWPTRCTSSLVKILNIFVVALQRLLVFPSFTPVSPLLFVDVGRAYCCYTHLKQLPHLRHMGSSPAAVKLWLVP